MPSSLSQRLSNSFRPSSRSSKRSSSIHDGRLSLSTCSDTNTLLSVEFPASQFQPRIEVIEEHDVLDPEDQAWGSPPPSTFTWSIPTFLRKKKTQT